MMQIYQIPPVLLGDWWPRISHMVEDSVSRGQGQYSAGDVAKAVLKNAMQLWIIMDEKEKEDEEWQIKAIVLTQVHNYPSAKICQMLCVTGEERKDWEHLILPIEQWALQNGCQGMELIARPGWERDMKNFGYKRTHSVLNKRLSYASH